MGSLEWERHEGAALLRTNSALSPPPPPHTHPPLNVSGRKQRFGTGILLLWGSIYPEGERKEETLPAGYAEPLEMLTQTFIIIIFIFIIILRGFFSPGGISQIWAIY